MFKYLNMFFAERKHRKSATQLLYANWTKHPQSNAPGRKTAPPVTKLGFLIVLTSPDGRIFKKQANIEGPPPNTNSRQVDTEVYFGCRARVNE